MMVQVLALRRVAGPGGGRLSAHGGRTRHLPAQSKQARVLAAAHRKGLRQALRLLSKFKGTCTIELFLFLLKCM